MVINPNQQKGYQSFRKKEYYPADRYHLRMEKKVTYIHRLIDLPQSSQNKVSRVGYSDAVE